MLTLDFNMQSKKWTTSSISTMAKARLATETVPWKVLAFLLQDVCLGVSESLHVLKEHLAAVIWSLNGSLCQRFFSTALLVCWLSSMLPLAYAAVRKLYGHGTTAVFTNTFVGNTSCSQNDLQATQQGWKPIHPFPSPSSYPVRFGAQDCNSCTPFQLTEFWTRLPDSAQVAHPLATRKGRGKEKNRPSDGPWPRGPIYSDFQNTKPGKKFSPLAAVLLCTKTHSWRILSCTGFQTHFLYFKAFAAWWKVKMLCTCPCANTKALMRCTRRQTEPWNPIIKRETKLHSTYFWACSYVPSLSEGPDHSVPSWKWWLPCKYGPK